MNHVLLTCKHHRDLRWFCKEIAFTPGVGYNGSRNIFFEGAAVDKCLVEDGRSIQALWPDKSIVRECECPPTDLILVEETING